MLDHAAGGGRIDAAQALALYQHAPFHELGNAADAVRRRRFAGTEHIATYLIDRNINYTNVCVTACRFCAFYRPPKSEEGWVRSVDDIVERCREAVDLGATQIMLQGGHHPDFGIERYEAMFSAIKTAFPQLALHSLGCIRGRAHRTGQRPAARRGDPPPRRLPGSTASPAPAPRSWWPGRVPRSPR